MTTLPVEEQPIESVTEAPFYIPATGAATRPRRSLKHGDTFIVVDSHGDIGATAGGPDGLFHRDTRFLSRFELLINGQQPLLLGSNVRDDNTSLSIDLTNPDFYSGQRIILFKDTLHVVRTLFLWQGIAYQRLKVSTTAMAQSRCSFRSCSTTISPTCSRCAARAVRVVALWCTGPNCRAAPNFAIWDSTAARGERR